MCRDEENQIVTCDLSSFFTDKRRPCVHVDLKKEVITVVVVGIAGHCGLVKPLFIWIYVA